MNNRLSQFLAAEQLTPTRFADEIGVQRSGISHILSGRNKPGYDFLEKFVKRYPSVNIEWFITGRGKMYKEQIPGIIPTFPESPADKLLADARTIDFGAVALPEMQSPIENNELAEHNGTIRENKPLPPAGKTLEKIILLYSDGSFLSYNGS